MNAGSFLFASPTQYSVYTELRRRVIALEPGLQEEFLKTQVSYRAKRKCIWLAPQSQRRLFLCLGNYQPIAHPRIDGLQKGGETRYLLQFFITAAEELAEIEAMGWLEQAIEWGFKER
jgi:hypothetical protein